MKATGDKNGDLLRRAYDVFPGASLGTDYLPEGAEFVAERGQGARVYDVEGRAYLDYLLGSGPMIRLARLHQLHPETMRAAAERAAAGASPLPDGREPTTEPAPVFAARQNRLLPGAFLSAGDYVQAQQARRVLADEYARLMREVDLVVALSGFELPCRLDRPDEIAATYERHARVPFNVTGAPALAVPTGFSRCGLPLESLKDQSCAE